MTFKLDPSPPRYSFIIRSFDNIGDLASWNDCRPVENLAELLLGQSNSTCCSSSLVRTPWVKHQGHFLYKWPTWLGRLFPSPASPALIWFMPNSVCKNLNLFHPWICHIWLLSSKECPFSLVWNSEHTGPIFHPDTSGLVLAPPPSIP